MAYRYTAGRGMTQEEAEARQATRLASKLRHIEQAKAYYQQNRETILACLREERYNSEGAKGRRKRVVLRSKLDFSSWVNTVKENTPCVDCKHSFPAVAMDFDHVRETKTTCVSKMRNRPLAAILIEMAKCDIVCASCHRIRTHARRKSGRI